VCPNNFHGTLKAFTSDGKAMMPEKRQSQGSIETQTAKKGNRMKIKSMKTLLMLTVAGLLAGCGTPGNGNASWTAGIPMEMRAGPNGSPGTANPLGLGSGTGMTTAH